MESAKRITGRIEFRDFSNQVEKFPGSMKKGRIRVQLSSQVGSADWAITQYAAYVK
jgi:hypothetical protein